MNKPLFFIRCTLEKKHLEEGCLEHQAVISLMKQVRIDFLKSHGMTEKCIVDGIGFMIGDLKVRYIRLAKENDNLEILLNIPKPKEGQKRCTIFYQIKKTDEDMIIATGTTEIIFVTEQMKAVEVPKKFLNILSEDHKPPITSWLQSKL